MTCGRTTIPGACGLESETLGSIHVRGRLFGRNDVVLDGQLVHFLHDVGGVAWARCSGGGGRCLLVLQTVDVLERFGAAAHRALGRQQVILVGAVVAGPFLRFAHFRAVWCVEPDRWCTTGSCHEFIIVAFCG